MKRKMIFRMFCLLLLTAVFLCGCRPGADPNQIGETRKIVVGEDSYEPYSDLNRIASPVAIDAELAAEAFGRMGYEVEFRRIDWEDSEQLLTDGELDCLWDCVTLKPYQTQYQWVGPYLYASQIVVVQADSDIWTLADLAGKRVAAQAGSSEEKILLEQKNPALPELDTIYSFETMTQVRTSLSKGYSDAIVGYEGDMMSLIETSPEEFRILDEPLNVVPLGVAFAKEYDPEVVAELEKTLREMAEDGTIREIVEKYRMDEERALGGKK